MLTTRIDFKKQKLTEEFFEKIFERWKLTNCDAFTGIIIFSNIRIFRDDNRYHVKMNLILIRRNSIFVKCDNDRNLEASKIFHGITR